MSYQYDVFLSYRRSGHGNAGQWVRNHFHPLLRDCLSDQVGWEPTIFFDLEVETGLRWPDLLADALRRSKMLVAVWSPPYFRSSWCLAEWQSMLAREQLLSGKVLIYPVVFSDSHTFPDAAKNRQSRDLKAWSNPFPAYQETRDYDRFYQEMQDVAAELGRMLAAVPAWQPDWPVHRPAELPTPRADLADL